MICFVKLNVINLIFLVKAPSFIISIRFLIAIIAFFGYAVQYIQKINMSVGIVCMVNNTAVKQVLKFANIFIDISS
jgi:hypothetical protein